MLVIFKKRDGTSLPLGPFKALRFHGGELHAADGPLIAKHVQHHWRVRGDDYLRLDCDGPITLAFLDRDGEQSREFGPCAHFSSIGGIAYRDHEVFCHLDEGTNRWHMRTEPRDWAELVVADAD